MKICIGGGKEEAIYIVNMFKGSGNELVIINSNKDICNMIVKACRVPVELSEPNKIYSFEDAGVKNFDLYIALSNNDGENFVMCQIAKQLFNFKKTICLVNNPYNVALFKDLGIDSPVSSTFMLTETIKNESNFENIFSSLSLENDNIVLTEIVIKKEFKITNQLIKDLDFPKNCNIACIYREPHVVVPKGNDRILPGDKLLIVSAPNDQKSIVKYVRTKA